MKIIYILNFYKLIHLFIASQNQVRDQLWLFFRIIIILALQVLVL